MQCLQVDLKGSPLFEAFGELKTVADWLKDPRCLVSQSTFKKRVFGGWTLEEALSVEPGGQGNQGQKVIVEAFGEKKTLEAWGRDARSCVPIVVMLRRISEGMSNEEAITKPSAFLSQDVLVYQKAS